MFDLLTDLTRRKTVKVSELVVKSVELLAAL
jgi:hypothetical protein